MRRTVVLLGFLLLLPPFTASGFDMARWGVHFQVYSEPHETDNPLYVNVVPAVYEARLGRLVTLKAGTILGLRFGDSVTIGNVGVTVGVPIYPFGITDKIDGFFAGPIVSTSYNLHTEELVISTAVDAGYSFYVAERLAISLGGEIGVSTFFAGDDVFALPHYGPSVYLFFR